MLYIYAHQKYINGGDIFQCFNDGGFIHKQFFKNQERFFFLMFNNESSPPFKYIVKKIHYWGNSNFYLLVRFNALAHFISMGNIYIHSILASFMAFVGCFYIAKTFEENIQTNKWVLYSIFLTPSVLFWTAGMHKEVFAVLALGLMLYHFFSLLEKKNIWKSVLGFLLGFFLFLSVRDYMLSALIPSLLAFVLYKVFNLSYKIAFIISGIALLLCFQTIPFPQYNYQTGMDLILHKRQQFALLENGNTTIPLEHIENNIWSLAKNTPRALFNTIARPHFLDMQNTFTTLAGVENFLLSILFLVAFLFLLFRKTKDKPFIVFMLLFSILLLLIIGWIVPNIGAILRYRSIALVVFVPILLQVVFGSSLPYRIINAKSKKIA